MGSPQDDFNPGLKTGMRVSNQGWRLVPHDSWLRPLPHALRHPRFFAHPSILEGKITTARGLVG